MVIEDVSWSERESLIAIAITENNVFTRHSELKIVTPAKQTVKQFTVEGFLESVAWLPDASALLYTIGDQQGGGGDQIWLQPYPSGSPVRVTNDVNSYGSISVSDDGNSVVAAQERPESKIYIGESPRVLNGRVDWRLSLLSREQTDGQQLAWTATGKLIERDLAGHLFVISGQGTRSPLLAPDEVSGSWTACGPGDSIVFTRPGADPNHPHLWRLDIGTAHLNQLTNGAFEYGPSCTPDGQTILFSVAPNSDRAEHVIFKLSEAEGVPKPLITVKSANYTVYPRVSPDGRYFAYFVANANEGTLTWSLVVRSLNDGSLVKQFEAPESIDSPDSINSSSLCWVPDGSALAFSAGQSLQLYLQPIAGGPPVQLTHFTEEPVMVAAVAWSRDGKKFAMGRARQRDTDVVMFSNFRRAIQ
jgi:Tol biopolymer transport system component